ncbi:MAG: hypothetical protein HC888_07430 [Candidatus Competibacteraceae bacterium]|nr:hypothetical protein [Candidatus Competibacteraceae bacterium]
MQIHIGARSCPLCQAYPWQNVKSCGSCPIALDTMQNNCCGTPYYAVSEEYHSETATNKTLLEAIANEYIYLVNLAFRHHEENPE